MFVIVASPYLVLIGAVIAGILLLVRSNKRKAKLKREKERELKKLTKQDTENGSAT